MSSMLVCAQPATSFPGLSVPQERPTFLPEHLASIPHFSRVTPAARLDVRPAPATVSTGLSELDELTGGLPRGCLTEILGPASSGRTSLLAAALATATRRQEACALVDVTDAFDPQSAAAAGMEFKNLLWVRCDPESGKDDRKRSGARFTRGNLKTEMACLEQALKVTDLILQSGGFGLVAIDMGGIPLVAARRIPLTSWFRFRRAVENTPTVLLVLGQGPCAGTCASLLLQLEGQALFVRSRGELSALSCQLSENDPDGRRTIGVHNFPNSQSSWALQQGRAVPAAETVDDFSSAPKDCIHERVAQAFRPAIQRENEWALAPEVLHSCAGERTSAAEQLAENFTTAAPKGDTKNERLTASLKRCPDTNRNFSATCGAVLLSGRFHAGLKCVRENVSRPCGTGSLCPLVPALKRWANLATPIRGCCSAPVLGGAGLQCVGESPSVEQRPSSQIIRAQGCEESTAEASVPAHAQLLDGISMTAELLRSRLERMPAQVVRTRFETKIWNR